MRLVLLFAITAAFASHPVPAKAPPKPLNILFIVADDQAWTDFGFMGHSVIQTPNLDRLAAEGAVFATGYVPTSLCRASLATLLTGQYGHEHRICCNDPPDGVDRAAVHPFIKNAPSLPRLLAQKGYLSLQTGKFWEGHFSNAGFTHGMTEVGRHGDVGLNIGRETLKPIENFLTQAGGKPWFIWYAPMLPHEPHNPPERLFRKYQEPGRNPKLAKYWAMCEWLDETVGQVIDLVRKAGQLDNTLVCFVVDNGWIQETGPRPTTRGNFAPKSKLSPYDMGLRTPLIFWRPGLIPPAVRTDLASTIDLAPTLLNAVGAKREPRMSGISLWPTAVAGKPLPRKAVFGEIYLHTWVDLNTPALNLTHRWVRQGRWKLIVEEATRKQELYDLLTDPHETRDLVGAEPAKLKGLQAELRRWWKGKEGLFAPGGANR